MSGVDVSVVTHPGTLYNYSAGVLCGVLVTERVMRKLAALQTVHLEQVKRLLHDSQGEVFPSMWTLHYPEGEQTVVNFIDTSSDVSDRIRNATTGRQPEAVFPVFVANSMEAAKDMADARHAALTACQPAPLTREQEAEEMHKR